MTARPTARRANVLTVIGAAAILTSGWVHFRLYFRGGYRGIAPESVAGITVSRSFALQAVTAVVIAELLVVSLRVTRLRGLAAAAGILFAGASLVAYAMSRTTGLLGFEEHATTTDAVIAIVAEVTAVAVLLPVLVGARRRVGQAAADSAAPLSSARA